MAAVIHKNKSNAAGNSEKVLHPWARRTIDTVQSVYVKQC